MIVSIESKKDDFSNLNKYLKKCKNINIDANKYGEEMVSNLYENSPKEDYEFATGWKYKIDKKKTSTEVYIVNNSHPETPINLAFLLNYGHATRNGGWVEGKNFIKPSVIKTLSSFSKDIERMMRND